MSTAATAIPKAAVPLRRIRPPYRDAGDSVSGIILGVESLGRIVRQARKDAAIGQRELALRAGTSQSAISRIENELEEPSFDRFAQIMLAFGYAPRIELGPVAVHDAEPARLLEQARKSPQERFEEGINWMRFLRNIEPRHARRRAA
jgi:transcriptional regulator with XRE-family HTH domain